MTSHQHPASASMLFAREEIPFSRFTSGQITYRMACHLGEVTIWREGPRETELFRMNIGVLAEVLERGRRSERAVMLALSDGIRELTPAERAFVWRSCAADPELRFAATVRGNVMRFGGWRGCLRRIEWFLESTGRAMPWARTGGVDWE